LLTSIVWNAKDYRGYNVGNSRLVPVFNAITDSSPAIGTGEQGAAMKPSFIGLLAMTLCLNACAQTKPKAAQKTEKPQCTYDGTTFGVSGGGWDTSIISCINGKWTVDEAATKAMHEREEKERKHRHDLYWALRTRVLTPQEMKEVEQYDYYLVVNEIAGYSQEEKLKEFNDALLQQFKLQAASANKSSCDPKEQR
jgi:hypothetical protein